jgi:hypothetical protein
VVVVFWQIIMAAIAMDPLREKSLADYRKKLLEHKEVESRLKESKISPFFWCKSRSEIQSRRSKITHLKYCMSSTLFLSKANNTHAEFYTVCSRFGSNTEYFSSARAAEGADEAVR